MIEFNQINNLLAIFKDPDTKKTKKDTGIEVVFKVKRFVGFMELMNLKNQKAKVVEQAETANDDITYIDNLTN